MKTRTWISSALVGMLILTASFPGVQAEQTQKVNLNVATSSELESLPGIGPSTAERILEFREKNGPFKRIEDLMNVRGIGETRFLRLRDYITVKRSSRGAQRKSPRDGKSDSPRTASEKTNPQSNK